MWHSTATWVKGQSDSSESFSLLADCRTAALCLLAAGVKPFCRNPTNLDCGNSVTRSLPPQTPELKSGAARRLFCVRDLMTAARHSCAVSIYKHFSLFSLHLKCSTLQKCSNNMFFLFLFFWARAKKPKRIFQVEREKYINLTWFQFYDLDSSQSSSLNVSSLEENQKSCS